MKGKIHIIHPYYRLRGPRRIISEYSQRLPEIVRAVLPDLKIGTWKVTIADIFFNNSDFAKYLVHSHMEME